MSGLQPRRKSIAILLIGIFCLSAATENATAFQSRRPTPSFQLAQTSLTPAERRERARRAILERQGKTPPPRETRRGPTRLGAAQGDDALVEIKAALQQIPALKGLKLLDLKKGPDGYSAALGTKNLAVAVFPAGKPVPARLAAARNGGPVLGSRRGSIAAAEPLNREKLQERTRAAIEARRRHGVDATRPSRDELQKRARAAIEARERKLNAARPSAEAAGQRALQSTEGQKPRGAMAALPGVVRQHLPQPIEPHGNAPAALSPNHTPAALSPNHKSQLPAGTITPHQAPVTPNKPNRHWNVALTESAFSFAQIARGRFGPLEDVHVKSLSLVVSAIDNGVALAEFPKAFRPSMKPFADTKGVVTLRKGVNFFGQVARFSGMLDEFRRAFGIKRGEVYLWGNVGGDFVRQFANGKAESMKLDFNDIRLGIELPGLTPVALQGIVDSGPVNLTFYATKDRIDGTGKTKLRIRLDGRTVTVDGTLAFDDRPAIDKDFVTVRGDFPKPQELLSHLPSLKVTKLGVDFRLVRRKGDKAVGQFDLDGEASFRNKPVAMTGTFDREDKNRTTIAVTISSDKLSFADFVPKAVALPALESVKIKEVRLRNKYVSTTARFAREDTTVYVFNSNGSKLPNILIVHDKFRFSDYVPQLKGTPVDDLGQLDNAMFLFVPGGNASGKSTASLTLADLPKPVLPRFSFKPGGGKRGGGHSGAGGRIDLKAGLNFFGHLDLKAPGAARDLFQKAGLDRLMQSQLPLIGVVDPAILRSAKDGAKKLALQIIESLDITAPLPDFKPPRFPGGMDLKNVVFSLKGEREPSQPDHVTVGVGIKGDIALAISGARFDLFGGLEVDKEISGSAKKLKFAAVAKHAWDHPLGLSWLSVGKIGISADLNETAQKSKDLDFKIGASGTIHKKAHVTVKGNLVVASGKVSDVELTISSDKLSFADFVPKAVALPALESVKIKEVHLRNKYVSTTARFAKEDTTVYVFATKGNRLPNILIVHDKFRFSDYVPQLKGTPVDDLGQLDNAMFLYVPGSKTSGGGTASLTIADLPKPVLPHFSFKPGGGHSGAGGKIDLKAGLNFFGRLDLKAPGAVKTMLEKVGLNKLQQPHLPLSGVVDPAILRSAKDEAKKLALQIIESLDITAPLPDFKPPRFPGGMNFTNVALSVKGDKEPSQPDHARVDVGVKGDISLSIRGKPMELSGGLELGKEIGGAAKALKFAAQAKHDWNHPLGLNWLSLKEIGLAVDLSESAQKSKDLDFKLDAQASINRKRPVKIEGELVVINDKLDDVLFRIPSRIDVKDIPHIGKLPGIDQFSFANLAISSRELAGDLTWKPKNITQKAALYFGGVHHDQVTLFYSLQNFSFGKLIPPLARSKVGKISLPKFVLTVSTHPMMQTKLGQLPQEVRKILGDVSKDPTYPMRIAQGVGLMAPLDPKTLGGDVKAALDHLNVKDAVVLGGGVGGVLSGAPHLDLKARLPRVPIPKKLPKFLRFTKDAGGALYLAYAGETMDLGVEVDADMVLGLADRTPKLVAIQLGVELGGSGGVGLRTTGSVQGHWRNAMGMIGLDLDEATFKFGVDADSAVEIGMKAKEVVEGNHLDYAILVAVIPEAVTPTKLAVAFDAQEFGLSTYLAMGDVYLKTAAAQPFFAALLKASLQKLGAKKATKSIDWYENKIKSAPSLNQLLPLGDLPLIHFQKVNGKLVMPGSGDPQLDLDPGVGLGGQLWLGKTELGAVDASLTFLGLKVGGDIALKHIGPLQIDKAKVDIDATLGLDPHFKILGDARLLGTRQDLEIYVGKKGLNFQRINNLGPMGKLTWKAKTKGSDLAHIKDFTIDGSFSTQFAPWLASALAAELKAGSKGLDHIATDVKAAQNALKQIKALAKARQDALLAAQRTLDAVNKKIETWPGGKAAVKLEKWLLSELDTAKKRVDTAKKALIKDSEILAYQAAHEAAKKAEAAIKKMAGSFAVNSATIHGSLRDSIGGKPIKLHLDATASGHRLVADVDFPLANPRNLNVANIVKAMYHIIKSDLFGKKA